MANRKKSDVPMEDEIPLLDIVLDLYECGDLDMSVRSRKCYLNEQHKQFDIITWIHNDELRDHLNLRKMGKQNAKVIIRK